MFHLPKHEVSSDLVCYYRAHTGATPEVQVNEAMEASRSIAVDLLLGYGLGPNDKDDFGVESSDDLLSLLTLLLFRSKVLRDTLAETLPDADSQLPLRDNGFLKTDAYRDIIKTLSECHGEDFVNVLHRVMEARGAGTFSHAQPTVSGNGISVVSQFYIEPTDGEQGYSTPRRLVSIALRTQEV